MIFMYNINIKIIQERKPIMAYRYGNRKQINLFPESYLFPEF